MSLPLVLVAALAIAMGVTPAGAQGLGVNGVLRVGIGVGPVGSAFWAVNDLASGRPRGITVDLAEALARRANLRLQLVIYANSGDVAAGGTREEWDAAFLPVDDDRRAMIDFGPSYYVFESTYLVPPQSPIATFADVDRPGVRVAAIGVTTTGRAARRSLQRATFVDVRTVEEADAALRSGAADAVAFSRESLINFAKQMPGARILDGSFQSTSVAVAVPKNRPAALAVVTAFLDEALASGMVRDALARAGIAPMPSAPPR